LCSKLGKAVGAGVHSRIYTYTQPHFLQQALTFKWALRRPKPDLRIGSSQFAVICSLQGVRGAANAIVCVQKGMYVQKSHLNML